MNTPSAKADGFFGESSYRRACIQLARSRPGASKDVERRILVPVDHQSAFTLVNANTQALAHDLAARRALLAGTVREHFFYFPTGSFSLVGEYIDEARPCDVGNRPGKSVMPH